MTTEAEVKILEPVDFVQEGNAVEVKLLRALAMGSKQSNEIQLLLDSQLDGTADYQALSLALTDHTVNESRARATFEGLRRHQARLQAALKRPVGIKTAAMDYLENIEAVLHLSGEEQSLTYSQLAQMAFTDYLTGLSNYRYFTTRFAEEIRRAERYRHLVSLIMLDIDYFKKFNDSFGHPAGNRAIEFLAQLLQSQVRETDLVGRYGGEEFAIILPETTKREAEELAERIRTQVENTYVPLEESGPQPIRVSLGVATFPRDARSPEDLLAAADAALYQSKKNGRNRVSSYEPPSKISLTYLPSNPQSAQSVSLLADFNGWDKEADPMIKGSDGYFRISLALTKGRYEYKFLVNKEWFIHDPLCFESTHDGYGGKNSVLVVK